MCPPSQASIERIAAIHPISASLWSVDEGCCTFVVPSKVMTGWRDVCIGITEDSGARVTNSVYL